MMRPSLKDVPYTLYISPVIYLFKRQCDAELLGITNQRLETHINQYLPGNILLGKVNALHSYVNISGKARGEHMTEN